MQSLATAMGVTPRKRQEEDVTPPQTAKSESELAREDIAKLAFALWQQRGCRAGSPEQDWVEAEQRLREAQTATAR